MTKKVSGINKKSKFHAIALVLIIIIIIWFYFKSLIRERKTKELESLKKKLEENKKLDAALKTKTKRTFLIIRIGVILIYFLINYFVYQFLFSNPTLYNENIDILLNYNTIFFIIVTALTFARFGSFNSYRNWWVWYETKIEVLIYRKSPDLKKIIMDDEKYKEQLENEIEKLNT